jgi:5,10-methylenetetrahydromethanopterin reductase
MSRAPALGLLGTVGAGPAEIGELALEAERAGFDGVWMVEFEYDTFAFDQVIAMRTKRITTGSCIARRFTRHPLLVAETAAVIDSLAPGRFVVGLGNGGVSEPASDAAAAKTKAAAEIDVASLQRWGMPGDRPVARMREYVDVIRLALSGETVDYLGEFYRFQGVKLSLVPESRIPVYLGARRPGMLRLAGAVADGVFLWLVGESATREAIGIVAGAAAEAGRSGAEIAMGCLVPACVDTDGEAARDAMRRYLVDFYLARGVYSDVLARAGFAEAGERVNALVARGEIDAAAAGVPEEAVDALTVAGSPDDCRARLRRWYARGLDLLVLYVFPVDGDWPRAYRRIIGDLSPGA